MNYNKRPESSASLNKSQSNFTFKPEINKNSKRIADSRGCSFVKTFSNMFTTDNKTLEGTNGKFFYFKI
jgi:hypothetical protein